MSLSFTIFIALLLDFIFGEPKKYHPLVGFGLWASTIEKKCHAKNASAKQQKFRGLIALILAISPILIVISILTQSATYLNPLILYLCIAPKSLLQHSLAVYQPLISGDIPQARLALSMIVSRKTPQMNPLEICKASIETVLENGADAIFSAIFWFIVAGPVGVICYRLSNTLDAMWGYKNTQYLNFGYAAAKLDDILNWIPSRLTALTYLILGQSQNAWHCYKTQSPLCESPNAGVVMSTGAGALQIQLGGKAIYHGKTKYKPVLGIGHQAKFQDIKRANCLVLLSLALWVSLIFIGESLA
jgi:adenosylcobinamide-phosphate synthase